MKLDYKYLIFSFTLLLGILVCSFLVEFWYLTLNLQNYWPQRQNLFYIILFFFGAMSCSSLLYFWSLVRKKKELTKFSDYISLGLATVLTTTSLKATWLILKILL